MAGTAPPAITYVVGRWGKSTETFVRREAAAVASVGVPVRARSIGRPEPAPDRTVDLTCDHLRRPAVVVGLLRTLAGHPLVSAHVLRTVLWRSRRGNRREQLGATVVGLAWAATLADRDSHLHVHFGWVAATAAWACTRLTGQPYSVVLHSFELHGERHLDAFAAIPLLAAVQAFTISAYDARLLQERLGVPAEVLHMGVTDEWLDAPPTRVPQPGTVLAVGSLVPPKGHDVLVRAVAAAEQPWQLTIVGEGPGRAGLEELVARLGLTERVHLVGWQDELDVRDRCDGAWVACLACVVAPDGDHDGIPVALMEAMARGVPVVTTDVGGVPELVQEGAGLVVPTRDVEALAAALDGLVDPDERRAVGERGRERVRREFAVRRSAAQVVQLLGGRGGDEPEDEAPRGVGSAAP